MKQLSIVFWVVVAGIGASFGGAVYTAVKERQPAPASAPHAIAVPAEIK